MKRAKRISLWLLIAALVISLVGCAQPAVDETSMEVVSDATTETSAAETTAAETTATETTATTEAAASTNGLDGVVAAYFGNMPKHIYKIKQAEFIDMVKAGIDGTVLDIRSAEAYAESHVNGAVNAPWGPEAIPQILTKIPADKPVYVYCVSGQTAGQTVMLLNAAGFDARSVNLGFKFGISKVAGVDEVLTTEPTTLTEDVTEIDPVVMQAIVDYYAGLAAVFDTEYKHYKISEDSLAEKMAAGEAIQIVSARSPIDFKLGHINGAINVPFGKDMAAGFAEIAKDKKVVVYCYSGQTAGQAVAALRLLGYDAVSLNGGAGVPANAPIGWTNKGYTLTSPFRVETVEKYFANMPEHIYKIKQDAFVEMVAAGSDATILDIRSAEDYAKGHVKGAVNAPWGGTAIAEILTKIPADKPLYVYCYSGQTAGQTVALLNMAGFDARSVNLGYNFGISKVDNYAAVDSSEVVELTEDVTEIDPAIAKAIMNYYKGLAKVKETMFKNYKVSEDNLKKMIDEAADFYLLSARSAEDFAAGHIQGAVNLPFGKEMAAGFAQLPKDKTIVVYCYSGQTAGQTVAALRLLGYDAVSLNGGAGVPPNAPIGWTNKGYSLEP